MSIRQRVLHEKAILVLVLFLGLLLLDPLIPGALTNLSFAAIGVAGAWLLSDRKSLSRKIIAVSSSAVVVAIALGKLLPEPCSNLHACESACSLDFHTYLIRMLRLFDALGYVKGPGSHPSANHFSREPLL